MLIRKLKSISIVLLISTLVAQPPVVHAQEAGPYSPEQVYFVMHDAVMQALQIDPDKPQPVWVSLTTVGSVVEPDDFAQVNDLANFCPAPSPVLTMFGRDLKLDAIYQHVMDSLVGPIREYSPKYHAARRVAYDANGTASDKLDKYRQHEKAYTKAWSNFLYAKDAPAKQQALMDMRQAEQDWSALGFRAEIDRAFNTIYGEEARSGESRQARRIQVLEAYRGAGLRGMDLGIGYVAPASQFSPEPSKWASSGGWVKVAFDSQRHINNYRKDVSSKRGFAGLSLGFLSVGGKAGGKRTTETSIDKVYKLTYEFELMRAAIRRPWLDTTLLFQPLDWTWKKRDNTVDFPYVSVVLNNDGKPQAPGAAIYDNKPVACAMLPLEAIVARKRKIVATVSKTDYEKIDASGKASAGGSVFGIFGGGGKQNWSLNVVNRDENSVTFSVEAEGIAVIGFVSQPLPQAPSPSTAEKWPADAWLPAPPTT